MTSRTLPLSEQRVAHFLEQGRGEPLVLVHGVGMQARAWGPQIDAFAKTHHVIAVDMPGHGGSTRLPGTPELQDYVRWMVAFIEQLGLGPVNLAGHSMGALVASGVAVERPDLVKRLAVVNGVHKRTAEAREAVIRRADELDGGALDIQTPLQRWFDEGETPAETIRDVRSWLEQVDVGGYAAAYRAFARGDEVYADRWPEIACPTLVLTGTDDANSTAKMATDMAALGKRATAVVVGRQRHMVNLTAPAEVNRAMGAWLEVEV